MNKRMNRLKLLFTGILMLVLTTTYANETNPDDDGKIRGHVYDNKSKNPIEYATIAIYNATDSSLISGAITDNKGQFELKNVDTGSYYVQVNFMGYNSFIKDDIAIDERTRTLDIGEIFLDVNNVSLDEVTVTSERNSVEYQIDKKVITVSENVTSSSMSAVEVLENIPSTRVDIEGNVSLRGSSGFTVLIDGKPTVLDPSDVLRQIPASTIQNIEIITNPSAKWQPDGTGGIINIVTKKNRLTGVQGLINIRGGRFGRYGGDILLNYRKDKINFYVGAELSESPSPGKSYTERRTTVNDTTTTRISNGESEWKRQGHSLRAGIDWDFSPKDNFSIEMRGGNFEWGSTSDMNYTTTTNFNNNAIQELSLSKFSRGGNYYSLTSNYLHKFDENKHELAIQANYRYYEGEEDSETSLRSETGIIKQGTKATEDGPGKRWDIRLDYTKPFGEDNNFESGFQLRMNNGEDVTSLALFNAELNDFITQPEFSNRVDYVQDIYAAYAILNGKVKGFGYQLGLRGEFTSRDIVPQKEYSPTTIERWDIFPTLHFSYQLPNKHQLMTSYSRRIDRPRGYYFEPFITWSDMFNVRQGNPALKPEYIDAMEIGYIKQWEESQLSFESYYRIKQNRIERIQSVYEEGVLLTTYENVGKDYSLGLEAMYNTSFFKWWEMTFMGNMYDYRIKGELYGNSFENSSFNWSTRINNAFRLKDNWRLQLDGAYNSPTITAQGESEGYYTVNCGVRADFMDKKLTAVVQVRDVFATAKYVSVTQDEGFYNYRKRASNAPSVSFTLSYRINNYKENRRRNNRDNGGEAEF